MTADFMPFSASRGPFYRSKVVFSVVAQLSPGARAAGAGALVPVNRAVFLAGQAVPGLNTDKPHRLGLGRPDQHIRVARNVAANRTAGIFFDNGQGLAAQVDHAEAIVGKQVVGQRDGADVAAKIIEIRAVEQGRSAAR